MNPLIIPLIKGAVEIFKSRQAFKENLKTKTTAGAVPVALAAAAVPEAMPADSIEAAVTQIALGVVALVMFLYRKHEG